MGDERLVGLPRGAPRERLLVVSNETISLYLERPELFGVSAWRDKTAGGATTGRDGAGALKMDVSIAIERLETLEVEMSAEPRAKLAEEGGGKSVTLQFADDTGAMLFRSRMREVLWGKGQTMWTGNTLVQPGEM